MFQPLFLMMFMVLMLMVVLMMLTLLLLLMMMFSHNLFVFSLQKYCYSFATRLQTHMRACQIISFK